jgi:hypothetical protein
MATRAWCRPFLFCRVAKEVPKGEPCQNNVAIGIKSRVACAKVSAHAPANCATMRALYHGGGTRQAMSKKDKKIKKLKRELKALKAELRELKSLRRRRTTVAKATKPRPKKQIPTQTPSPAPERLDVDTPPQMSMTLKSISAVRSAG